ncbi:sulfatase-like hydrolase/transferase [Agreia sp.]|uniref:sulfatase-like hydrolase/transferase n=1 Tax=Agreia sp. TaxID=1872416 RepID=UPI0035BBA9B6
MNSRTNIVLIVADDLGFGDLAAFNPASAIVTPNLDFMGADGGSFTDAHATSSVCSLSRYSMLTGRYNWRSGLKSGIVCMWDGPMIEEGQHTIASILGDAGYDTACIGKWHLGWDWPTHDGSHPNDTLPHGLANAETHQHRIDFGYQNIDFSRRIAGGPTDRGGIKRDAWEGGHRVPRIAEWPGVVPAGSRSNELISLVDLLPTLLDVADVPLPPDLRPDGVCLLASFEGREGPVRDGIVTHSGTGKFGIRRGDWMYIDAMSGAENDEPAWLRETRGYTSDDRPGGLYNLVDDPQQRMNSYQEHPQLVAELAAELHRLRTPR